VDRIVTKFGRLDAAFNHAGVMARIAPTRSVGAIAALFASACRVDPV